FLASLGQKELLLYLFLILAADRNGLSYYSYDRICSLLQLSVEQYSIARDALIKKDLLAFDGTLFQVLDLPPKPLPGSAVSRRSKNQNPVPIAGVIQQSLKGICHE
ncbi:MAG: helix-turn-helix domain-containing protein, partial [Deltaproteobacteria bacterium]|nr:helix-turn-helix domain-containing protein [Deltaproteobacteria bacterium]